MAKLNDEQTISAYRLYKRVPLDKDCNKSESGEYEITFDEFCNKMWNGIGGNYVMTNWCGCVMGIESDGYMHS